MVRQQRVGDNKLFLIANYLINSEACTEIHAEVPARYRTAFEEEYAEATSNFGLPSNDNRSPYYVLSEEKYKYGRELRIYFALFPPLPPLIRDFNPVCGQWHERPDLYRINHTNLVMQLFECGFVLGRDQDAERVANFMKQKFPVTQ